MSDKKQAGRIAGLRKYIHTPMEAEFVREMVTDGLKDDQILAALGYPTGKIGVQADHGMDNKLPTDEEEQIAESEAKGEDPQPELPAESGSGEDVKAGEQGAGQSDPLDHVVGLLRHLVGQKPKNTVKK